MRLFIQLWFLLIIPGGFMKMVYGHDRCGFKGFFR